MQSLRPEALTHAELQDYAHLIGPQDLPSNWVGEIIKRSQLAWKAPHTVVNPQQLELF